MVKGYTHVCVLLDASYSMRKAAGNVKAALRDFLMDQRLAIANGEAMYFDAYKFGSKLQHFVRNAPFASASDPIGNYCADMYGTALNDAICVSVDELGQFFASQPENLRPDAVLFVIVTDGHDNSSKRYAFSDVQKRVVEQTNKYNWKFILIATGIDGSATAVKLGFDLNAPDGRNTVCQCATHAELGKNLRSSMNDRLAKTWAQRGK